MPTGYIKEIAKKKHQPVGQVEQKWQEAKKLAEKSAKHQNKNVGYGYVTNIFKNLTHTGKKSGGRSKGKK